MAEEDTKGDGLGAEPAPESGPVDGLNEPGDPGEGGDGTEVRSAESLRLTGRRKGRRLVMPEVSGGATKSTPEQRLLILDTWNRSGLPAKDFAPLLGRMASSETWARRVAEWRASGKKAEAFAAGRGFAGSTLRWWASRLGRSLVEIPSRGRADVVDRAHPGRRATTAGAGRRTWICGMVIGLVTALFLGLATVVVEAGELGYGRA